MARYDRIAPLPAPVREQAFPGWPVLRDLEASDRDMELARRARLRFLALRPIRRLLDRGITTVSRDSYLAQIEGVREELGYLPTRDVERARLARFLHNIEERDPVRLVLAALDMADACVTAGQLHGAEEYALTGLGIAGAVHDPRMQAAAYVVLARVARNRARTDAVNEYVSAALALAESTADRTTLVRASAEQALMSAQRGEATAARDLLNDVLRRAHAAHDMQAAALTQAKLCACEMALGNAAVALDHGWAALRVLDDVRERALLLEQVGNAFSTLGLHKAAERCFSMVAQRGVDSALRARARASLAVASAAVGNAQLFRDRRNALLNDAAEWSADPRVLGYVHVELGRGCLIVRDYDDAREHLRTGINVARRHSMDDILANAEEVLGSLEQKTAVHLVRASGNGPAAEAARRIAEQLEALPDLPVIAT